ncbi:hypothetical protein B0H16DRAFT_1619343 [Mycena metata]|uniref:HTH cro/C1-type domain-containing protein n=1 Tax=Mycena metata TaxID=1033252 RepID=A0AAD7MEU2_9AGAR|nr:hypothetical protein B0H16DRAFT_1619343 [Mycena metata]
MARRAEDGVAHCARYDLAGTSGPNSARDSEDDSRFDELAAATPAVAIRVKKPVANAVAKKAAAPKTKINPAVGHAIASAREAKGLPQKDLATAINEPVSVVVSYKSSRAVPTAQDISKLQKVLGIKLV